MIPYCFHKYTFIKKYLIEETTVYYAATRL
jgi:hypothetical protein